MTTLQTLPQLGHAVSDDVNLHTLKLPVQLLTSCFFFPEPIEGARWVQIINYNTYVLKKIHSKRFDQLSRQKTNARTTADKCFCFEILGFEILILHWTSL